MEKRQKPSLHNDWIDPRAVEIVRRLQERGYTTYLVGGCVRDLLAGIHPKDYDIATQAQPEEVRKIIKGSYIIGRRFQLVLVKRGDQQFEVATFRRNALPEEQNKTTSNDVDLDTTSDSNAKSPMLNRSHSHSHSHSQSHSHTHAHARSHPEHQSSAPKAPRGHISADNFFGTPEEDAQRRDFSINALFYDPINNDLIDYVDGIKDIEAGIVRMIGNPSERIAEDPIRILRAIRIAHKLKFSIEPNLRKVLRTQAEDIRKSVLPRKREEYLKFLKLPDPSLAFLELMDLNILNHTLPTLHKIWETPEYLQDSLYYLQRSEEIIGHSGKTVHVVLPLYLALMNLLKAPVDSESLYIDEGEFHPEVEKQIESIEALLREEMGLFRAEQIALAFSFKLQDSLYNVARFLKRGVRRQKAFLTKEELPLALTIAEKDYTISPSSLNYWYSKLKEIGFN